MSVPPATAETPTVVVVSVQGEKSLFPRDLESLGAVARLRTVARDDLPPLTAAEAAEVLADADVVGLTPKVLPELDDALLSRLPRLRAVGLHATGTDMIDTSVLERHGVALAALPEYATVSVAEHALAMLMSLAARVHLGNDRSRGLVAPETSLRGFELRGRTLGIVGLGRIGTYLAGLARGLGMQVVATDPAPAGQARPPVPLVSLSELLAGSDAVAVCCSRSWGDPPVLGRAELAAMRPGAAVVVVSHHHAVDSAAAAALVRSGRLRGYAIDDAVLDLDANADVLAQGRVVQTGHRAWWSDEVLDRGARMWAGSLRGLVTGDPADPVHFVVRPDGWTPPGQRPVRTDGIAHHTDRLPSSVRATTAPSRV